MVHFGRVSTAMVTPFDRKGNIDFTKTTKLVNHLISNGTDSLVVAGTTGESPTLSTEEKIALFKQVVKAAEGRVPVIAGTGSNNTYASIELTKKAEEIGVDGIMLVAPYYSKPNQAGLFEHFHSIANSTSLPVMIYNIPGRAAVNIAPETIIELSKVENIIAVKEASGDLGAMAKIIEGTDETFQLYSGDDGLALPVLAIGGNGVVSVASHVIGPEMQEMVRLFEEGDHQQAATLHRRLLPLMGGLFQAPSPAPVKTALQMTGFDVGSVRLPLVPLSEQERSSLLSLLESVK
ncbi:4-hydroxy-tetrahydrodipicolinate synthase [Lederbergia citrea]|uniref:4-hydroxy-tetrahydrodipicolinate synthase n=1 Tax=Lederbergia citrea TaxID=2833581 RepID=A0A942Z3T3_9BACI|nr:4-hydroxy-tetrahydrodipicolinate synthase [Lederbergia citrea]MBS4177067.1 4-hydroxy-tetrahydrodipicolinate synthase [Lederbergia citrea]MBS4221685.1 4-hydroxy-tetrahydrodipicolinate synthase [Lederbergia citrea]